MSRLWTIDPADPKLRYVCAQVEKSEAEGVEDIWAGYVTYERRLLGVAEGINRDVVMRLLRRKVENGGAHVVVEQWSRFNNVKRARRK